MSMEPTTFAAIAPMIKASLAVTTLDAQQNRETLDTLL